jgi:hypothetical protein
MSEGEISQSIRTQEIQFLAKHKFTLPTGPPNPAKLQMQTQWHFVSKSGTGARSPVKTNSPTTKKKGFFGGRKSSVGKLSKAEQAMADAWNEAERRQVNAPPPLTIDEGNETTDTGAAIIEAIDAMVDPAVVAAAEAEQAAQAEAQAHVAAEAHAAKVAQDAAVFAAAAAAAETEAAAAAAAAETEAAAAAAAAAAETEAAAVAETEAAAAAAAAAETKAAAAVAETEAAAAVAETEAAAAVAKNEAAAAVAAQAEAAAAAATAAAETEATDNAEAVAKAQTAAAEAEAALTEAAAVAVAAEAAAAAQAPESTTPTPAVVTLEDTAAGKSSVEGAAVGESSTDEPSVRREEEVQGGPATAATAEQPAATPLVAAVEPSIADELSLSPDDLALYSKLWSEIQADNGLVSATVGVAFFQTSGLAAKKLRAIWGLADASKPKGKLTEREFFVALKLVALAQAGMTVGIAAIGTKAPCPAVGSAATATAVGPTEGAEADAVEKELAISNEDLKVYRTLFGEVEKKEGFVAAGVAVKFFQTSGLATQVLRTIWGLSDSIGKKGRLGEREFFTALKLMALAQADKPVAVADLTTPTPLPKVGSLINVTEPAAAAGVVEAELGLSLEHFAVYQTLWAETKAPAGQLSAKSALALFSTSGLSQGTLGGIWNLANTSPPKGSLKESEFYVALKLMALAQDGSPVEVKGLEVKSSLPKVGSAAAAPVAGAGPTPCAGGDAAAANTPDVEAELSLTAEDLGIYAKLWGEVDTPGDVVTATVAVTFFQTSGLDKKILRSIWGLADTLRPKGKLSKREFYTALKLMALAQAGKPVDVSALTLKVALPRVGSAVNIQASDSNVEAELALTADDLKIYQTLWGEVDAPGGFVAAGTAVRFFQTSGLDQKILRTIWGLSDTLLPKGKLSQREFYTALKLMSLAQADQPIEISGLQTKLPLPRVGSLVR